MIYILIALLIVVLIPVLVSLLNPLRKSDERIRDNMLTVTPIGMSMEDVIEVIESNGKWRIKHILDGGYSHYRGSDVPIGPNQGADMFDGTIVGVKTIEVDIGSYNFLVFILREEVSIFYGFDEDSKLVDLAIRRYAMDTL